MNRLRTRELEICSNLNSLTKQERSMLYMYFVLGLRKSDLKFIFKLGYANIQKKLTKLIRKVVS